MLYEFTFLLPEEAEAKTIQELIHSQKGKIQNEEAWGKKILAYPIKKHGRQTAAFYYHWLLDLEQNQITELKKKLNFNEKLIRYLLLKV